MTRKALYKLPRLKKDGVLEMKFALRGKKDDNE